VAAIRFGLQEALYIGNLDAKRDWGHARDYVEGMWRIVQQDQAEDYVLATGEAHTVREFIELAFAEVGRTIAWEGSGSEEIGRDTTNNKVVVRVDPVYFRPTEVDLLLGDPTKARQKLGWRHATSFKQLVAEMVSADIRITAQQQAFKSGRSLESAEDMGYVD
jgi:GDPmannose 4,6-dehydratase